MACILYIKQDHMHLVRACAGAAAAPLALLPRVQPYQKKLFFAGLQNATICSMLITHYHKITL
jgi:hypothetical protein